MARSFAGQSRSLHRVLDANLNRAREGLRVCEELARLMLDDSRLTGRFQRLRYDVHAACSRFFRADCVQARDARRDVGRPGARGPVRRYRKTRDLAQANLRRVQEALRVLEEFSRIASPRAVAAFGRMRFRAYSLEQNLLRKLSAVRHR